MCRGVVVRLRLFRSLSPTRFALCATVFRVLISTGLFVFEVCSGCHLGRLECQVTTLLCGFLVVFGLITAVAGTYLAVIDMG